MIKARYEEEHVGYVTCVGNLKNSIRFQRVRKRASTGPECIALRWSVHLAGMSDDNSVDWAYDMKYVYLFTFLSYIDKSLHLTCMEFT